MHRSKLKHSGFGLVEVLITVAILAIGLLGLSSLQNRAIQLIQEGDNLANASLIAEEAAKRMMSNNYILSWGREGYLHTDFYDDTSMGLQNWIDATLGSNSDMLNCYSQDSSQSCLPSGGSFSNSPDHIQALENMQYLDQVELREWAMNALPEGEIKLCFDSSSNALTQWNCDNVATRLDDRKENIFTVKVRWRNLYSNELQIFALQFTAQCTDGSSTYCGN